MNDSAFPGQLPSDDDTIQPTAPGLGHDPEWFVHLAKRSEKLAYALPVAWVLGFVLVIIGLGVLVDVVFGLAELIFFSVVEELGALVLLAGLSAVPFHAMKSARQAWRGTDHKKYKRRARIAFAVALPQFAGFMMAMWAMFVSFIF